MASTMQYLCSACGHSTAKWLGRCPQCREWGTIAESAPAQRTVRTQAKPAREG
ncbi:MAG TPA: DNA repair protein RadA, partial [Brevibacterium sp.]|nr:DNA repair protein RadA [Brevibacterium sp.]